MLGEPYSDDLLPWGVALIPDWWAEVTPHHTLDFEEIERQRQREQARLANLTGHFRGALSPDHLSEDGSLKSSAAAGPYTLPGFQSSDGIHDASFCNGTGQPRWYITTDGYFYCDEEPDVRYTAKQMVESGYLPDGMDQYFEPGWDRVRALSTPVDNAMYARTEQSAWERPDWLKKKLRSTDQGTALRYGLSELEGKVVTPKRRLHDEEEDDAVSALSGDKPLPGSPAALGHSPEPSNAWKKKQEDHADNVPDWKRKRDEILKAKAAAAEEVIIASGTVENTSSPAPHSFTGFFKPKKEETPKSPVAAWKPPVSPKKETVPAWKKKAEDPPTSAPVPPWKKKAVEDTATSSSVPSWPPPKKETVPRPAPIVPSWKAKKEEEAKAPAPAPVPAPAPAPPLEPEPMETEPEVDPEAVKQISQELVLKLLALPDDAARAKELRNTIAPSKKNNHKVLVKPEDLLIAVTHHAQAWKGLEDSKEKIDSLRQVAIIARLVIMKLYGSKSPELKQFEDGLRPAFANL